MGYYLSKSNPDRWKLEDFLGDFVDSDFPFEGDYTTCKDAQCGDTLFIGLSGPRAGIYAVATITSEKPRYVPVDSEYWVYPEDAKKRRWKSDVIFEKRKIVLEPALEVAKLNRVVRLLHSQGAAYHLTEQEGEALNKLISP